MPYMTAFMSHSHADNVVCDLYAEALEKRGVRLFYDRDHLDAGSQLAHRLEQKLRSAKALIVMATPAALASKWVNWEIETFFEQMKTDSTLVVIPIRLAPCEVPPELKDWIWVDATQVGSKNAVTTVANALKMQSGYVSRRTLLVIGALGTSRLAGPSVEAWVNRWHLSTSSSGSSLKSRATSPGDLLFTYRDHSDRVLAVAWSPNGKRVASAGWDKTVQIWDAADGGNPSSYRGHRALVTSVAWSPSGSRIASASNDGTVQIWDALDNRHPVTYTYQVSSGVAESIAWSPSGISIASAELDATVSVWDAENGNHPFTYSGHSNSVISVSWSPSGSRIASASDDGTVRVWDAEDGGHPFTYIGHSINRNSGNGRLQVAVNTVAWSPKGTRIASGSYDNTAQTWNAGDGGSPYTYRGHSDPVLSVWWSPDGTRLASASADRTVHVWDANNGANVFIYRGHSDAVTCVTWSPDGKYIASASDDKTVQVWRPQ